jgi:hypothetical protein
MELNTEQTFSQNAESLGYEHIGTVYVATETNFTSLSEAYAAASQDDSGFNTDSLSTDKESYRQEIPTNYLADGSLVVGQNFVDALNFAAKVDVNQKEFVNLGQVNLYIKDNNLYYEIVTNTYNTSTNNFTKSNPTSSSPYYNQVYQGLSNEK